MDRRARRVKVRQVLVKETPLSERAGRSVGGAEAEDAQLQFKLIMKRRIVKGECGKR